MRLVLSSLFITTWVVACAIESPAPDLEPEAVALAGGAEGPSCSGKARCACFEADANGNSKKVNGSDFAGICDPAAGCAPTCDASKCTRGQAQGIGDSCRVVTATPGEVDEALGLDEHQTLAAPAPIPTAVAPAATSAQAQVPTGCSCGLWINGTRFPAYAVAHATLPTFDVSIPAFGFSATLDPAIPFTCEDACEYGKAGFAAQALGVGDAP